MPIPLEYGQPLRILDPRIFLASGEILTIALAASAKYKTASLRKQEKPFHQIERDSGEQKSGSRLSS